MPLAVALYLHFLTQAGWRQATLFMCVLGALAILASISPGRLEAYRLFYAAAKTHSDGYAGDRYGGDGVGRVFIAQGHPKLRIPVPRQRMGGRHPRPRVCGAVGTP
jgi:hypothetical protein